MSGHAEHLRQQLPDIGDGLHAQLSELSKRPRADAAERLAINLEGARRVVMTYREELLRQGAEDGQ